MLDRVICQAYLRAVFGFCLGQIVKKALLALPLLLCLSAAHGEAAGQLEPHEIRLLVLHLGLAHPLAGALLAPPPPISPAVQKAKS